MLGFHMACHHVTGDICYHCVTRDILVAMYRDICFHVTEISVAVVMFHVVSVVV